MLIVSSQIHNIFACSCGERLSFSSTLRITHTTGVVELQVTEKGANYVKTKVLKIWEGNYQVGDDLTIWNYIPYTPVMCEQSVNISYLEANKRYIVMLDNKTGKLPLPNPYDTIGQAYIPFNICGATTLKIEGDSVIGETFGSYMVPSMKIGNMEGNMLYTTFIDRFNAIITDLETPIQIEAAFEISPNPVNKQLTLQGYTGKVIISNGANTWETYSAVGGSIDVSHLASGWYILECLLPDRTIRKKFVKE